MGLPDPHDPRMFTHLARINDAGDVVAVVEIADTAIGGAANPQHDGSTDTYLDVTELVKEKTVDVQKLSAKDLKAALKAARG